jgi:hypothetical protein
MKKFKQVFTCWEVVFEDGSYLCRTYGPIEWAAFKRSNRYKKVLSKKRLFEFEIITRIPASIEKNLKSPIK